MLKEFKETRMILALGIMLAIVFVIIILPPNNFYGKYVYKSTVFETGFSSYRMTKENSPIYEITEDYFAKIYSDRPSYKAEATYEKTKVDKEEFKSLFIEDIGVPNLFFYINCYKYSINDKYSLYMMDRELWLVERFDDKIMSIYKLKKGEN